ncbi:hypothetical protein K450DRAFT_235106 [Umbelopsis ramanniana AG]|uniref:Uncharacterized protein n=1 Tax=Umbelopsis ramanniana AG TaxID=1314678 RepID=A0AAD5EDB9_UMBRA|nr:uncharacterized protein K450DRAFT_235106 [Umbelopsis ramanniana AG]KAI8580895.1 hypothetical protein K450DRAFT_235106 [Umbelopsis ramanniana AG]
MTCVCRAEFCYRCGNPWTHENYTGCIAKCQSWSNAKLAEERKKNMPALPGLESVAKSKIKDGKANALRRSKTITREIEANRARNVVGGRIREMFRR